MRKLVIIVLFFYSHVVPTWASEQDSLFTTANQFYQIEQFEKAYQLYDGLVREGVESENLFFNYANACMHKDEVPMAIAYYYKARKSNPTDKLILNNLMMAQKKLGLYDASLQGRWLNQWDDKTIYLISIITAWISVLLVMIIIIFTPAVKRKYWWATSSVIFGLTVFFAVVSTSRYQEAHRDYAISLKESIIYKSPSSLSMEVYEIFEGQKVIILESKSSWVKIKTDKNKEGWLPAEKLLHI